jgi:ribosomal protein S18 acetylase RimI-like enzyme
MCLGGFQLLICFDVEKPVGVLAYKIDDESDQIELFKFAVLPAYQRRGIGVELLRQVQGIASGRRPIFVSGINDPAFVPLERAGFWRVKDRLSSATHKWSDLPAHKNDDTPFAEEDEDE